MSFEAIHFQSREDGVYINGRWPRFTRMTVDLLGTSGLVSIDDAGHVCFIVKNGSAKYKLSKKQESVGLYATICLERIDFQDWKTRQETT